VLRNAANYHPQFVLKVCADWAKGKNIDTAWIIKDALTKLRGTHPEEVAKNNYAWLGEVYYYLKKVDRAFRNLEDYPKM
jgi:3-methyladenine DNA glycosylase AlkC